MIIFKLIFGFFFLVGLLIAIIPFILTGVILVIPFVVFTILGLPFFIVGWLMGKGKTLINKIDEVRYV